MAVVTLTELVTVCVNVVSLELEETMEVVLVAICVLVTVEDIVKVAVVVAVEVDEGWAGRYDITP